MTAPPLGDTTQPCAILSLHVTSRTAAFLDEVVGARHPRVPYSSVGTPCTGYDTFTRSRWIALHGQDAAPAMSIVQAHRSILAYIIYKH
eukprot:SAG31_NODE_1406_length_8487_cov_4.584883_1_plen_88_part_10